MDKLDKAVKIDKSPRDVASMNMDLPSKCITLNELGELISQGPIYFR